MSAAQAPSPRNRSHEQAGKPHLAPKKSPGYLRVPSEVERRFLERIEVFGIDLGRELHGRPAHRVRRQPLERRLHEPRVALQSLRCVPDHRAVLKKIEGTRSDVGAKEVMGIIGGKQRREACNVRGGRVVAAGV